MFGVTYKIYNLVYLIAFGNMLFYFYNSVLQTCVAAEYQSVGVCDMSHYTVANMLALKNNSVHTVVCNRITAGNYVRRNILLYTATALY